MENKKESTTLDHKIKNISHKLMSTDLSHLQIGLFSGKMGICICYYHLAHKTGDKAYEHFAEKLLDEVYSKVPKTNILDIDSGLSGIGWGINYLIKNNFVQGNVNHVLRDIDDQIFSVMNLNWEERVAGNSQNFVLLLYYLYERLKAQKKGSPDEYLYQQLIIKIINRLDDEVTIRDWKEHHSFNLKYLLPSYLLILSRLFELNFFNYKISKTFDELSSVVLSAFPLLHIHRLWLLVGIQSVLEQTSIPAWQEHATLLSKNIDHQKIVSNELKNKNIHLHNGLSGYVLLLNVWDKFNDKNHFSSMKSIIFDKINTSDCWKGEFSSGSESPLWNVGLWEGFSGIALMYHLFLTS